MTNVEVRRLRSQILALNVATALVMYAIGLAIPALTPVPAFANDHTSNDDTNDNTNNYHTNDNTDYSTNHHTNNDNTNDYSYTSTDTSTDSNTNNDNTNNNNDYNILLFLIDVIECFTDNDEQFSDDTQACLYDVIGVYFDSADNNNLNNDNNGLDNNNDDISSNDNNDDDDNDDSNNDISSQET